MQKNIQQTHNDHTQASKEFPLRIIANDITSPLNVGSLFRLCDALGIEKLYLCGDTAIPPNNKITKTSRSTEKYVSYETHESAEKIVTRLKESGALIISLEITTSSIDIRSDEFKDTVTQHANKLVVDDQQEYSYGICLILGSENAGISEALLSLSDITTHIPMVGNNSSMNVISAASIACFEITRNM